MKRIAFSILSMSLFIVGCGGGGNNEGVDAAVDAPPQSLACPDSQNPSNPGFICPTKSARAWTRENNTWTEVGPADFSCLNTPGTDTASTVDIAVTSTVRDFQDSQPITGATVEAFPGVDFQDVLATGTTDASGNATLTLPAGQTRVGYKVVATGALDTYTLHLYYVPDQVAQTENLFSVSEDTANLVTALLGIQRTPGTGILAGSIVDCQGNPVSDVIATVSSDSGSHTHLEGAKTYYFTAGNTSLPTTHATVPQTNKDGLFVTIELPVAPSAYLQVWGFTEGQDPATDTLTLIAEIPSPVVADSVIIAGLEPLRQ